MLEGNMPPQNTPFSISKIYNKPNKCVLVG